MVLTRAQSAALRKRKQVETVQGVQTRSMKQARMGSGARPQNSGTTHYYSARSNQSWAQHPNNNTAHSQRTMKTGNSNAASTRAASTRAFSRRALELTSQAARHSWGHVLAAANKAADLTLATCVAGYCLHKGSQWVSDRLAGNQAVVPYTGGPPPPTRHETMRQMFTEFH